ncbi:MAG: tetratricopeptide repeat protein [Myxococcota bacterium]
MSELETRISELENQYKEKPWDTKIIFSLLDLYEKNTQWEKCTDMFKRLAELEENKELRSKYYFNLAQILHYELKNPKASIEYYNKSLNDDYSNLTSFDNMVKALHKLEKWRKLERVYKKFIKNTSKHYPDEEKLLFRLWKELGILYKTKINDEKAAEKSLSKATEFNSKDAAPYKHLSEIYTQTKNRDKAIQIYRKLLEKNPYDQKNLNKLFELYFEQKEIDKALCVAEVIKLTGNKNKTALNLLHQNRKKKFKRIGPQEFSTAWEILSKNSQDDYQIGKIFAFLSLIIPAIRKISLESATGKNAVLQSPDTEGPAITSVFYYIMSLLNTPPPLFYLMPDVESGLNLTRAIDKDRNLKVFTAGNQVLTGYNEKELIYLLFRHLIYTYDEYILIKLFRNNTELFTVLLGAIRFGNPRLKIEGDQKIINKTANQIDDLLPLEVQSELRSLVKELTSNGLLPDFYNYINKLELLSIKLCFLLIHDIEAAFRITEVFFKHSPLTLNRQKYIITKFSISDEYFKLRQQFNLNL